MTAQVKVRVQCQCGKAYKVSSSILGKKVKCKACSQTFVCHPAQTPAKRKTAPQPTVTAALVSPTKPCESCGEKMPQDTIICILCGFNHRTKKKLKRPADNARAQAAAHGKRKRKAKVSDKQKSQGSFLGFDFQLMFEGLGMIALGCLLLVLGFVIRGCLGTALSLIGNGISSFHAGFKGSTSG